MEEMNQTNQPAPQPNSFPPVPEQRAFPVEKKDLLFLLFIGISSLAMCNFILYGFNLGYAIAACGCILSSALYLHARGMKGNWYSRAVLGLCLIIAAAFGRSDDSFVKFVMFCFLMVGINLGLCLTAGQNLYAPGSFSSLADACRTFFPIAFGELPASFRGLKAAFQRSGTVGKKTAAILAGAAIAVPVLAIMIPLLISADAAFDGLISLLPAFELYETFFTAAFGSGLACLLFSRGIALAHREKRDTAADFSQGKISKLTVNTVLIAVCLLYFVYLLSQLAYFVNGFAGILPEGFTAAEYARRGFFEMAWLCAINLALITLSIGLVNKTGLAPKSTRLLCLFIGCVTLFFVVAACAKMVLYIDLYGLTRLRVLTMVIMAFLAVTTILVSVWLFIPKLQYMKAVMLIALAMGAAVIWWDVDTVVARYNVDAYLSGRLQTVDIFYLNSLGDGAVAYIEQLSFDAPDENIREAAASILESRRYDEPEDFREWNYTTWYAGITMKDYQDAP